jgi:hypothetical protein
LQQADALFTRKYYLSPINNNAYAIYVRVLLADPTNAVALGRIEQMKQFYRTEGTNACRKGDKTTAETFFRRYLIIEPSNIQVQGLLASVEDCVASLTEPTPQTPVAPVPNTVRPDTASPDTAPLNSLPVATPVNAIPVNAIPENAIPADSTKPDTEPEPAAENKQKIRKLLQEEGVESEWIVEYLFDEGAPEADVPTAKTQSDTPW